MSRKYQQKQQTLADNNVDNSKLVSAAIFRVLQDQDNAGTVDTGDDRGIFLLNPSTWEESKTANWIPHNIPGQSDPILQWVSSGARVVTFDTLVTNDTTHFTGVKKSGLEKAIGAGLAVVGGIASAFAGINVPPLGDLLPVATSNGENLSIVDSLNFYRSLVYPLQDPNTLALTGSPPLVVLYAGKTFGNPSIPMGNGKKITADDTVWVVTNYKIRITKQLPNLTPMEAVVSFQLMEYVLQSRGRQFFDGPSPQAIGSSAADGLLNLGGLLG